MSEVIPLEKVPSIMQAMGFYPSNQEIVDMINEVKYSRFSQGQGEEVDSISFHDLIRLYLNHRPYENITVKDLEIALSHARRLEAGRPVPVGPVKKMNYNQLVKTDGLLSLLQQYGI